MEVPPVGIGARNDCGVRMHGAPTPEPLHGGCALNPEAQAGGSPVGIELGRFMECDPRSSGPPRGPGE
eukprot:718616-Alexandrium_andersonii.AAC.1